MDSSGFNLDLFEDNSLIPRENLTNTTFPLYELLIIKLKNQKIVERTLKYYPSGIIE